MRAWITSTSSSASSKMHSQYSSNAGWCSPRTAMRGILTWACDSESGIPCLLRAAPGRRHRRRLRWPGRGACPARRRRRGDARRRQQLPHLPAAPLPGGDGRAGRRERRLRHPGQRPRPPLAALQRDRPDGARVVGRPRRTAPSSSSTASGCRTTRWCWPAGPSPTTSACPASPSTRCRSSTSTTPSPCGSTSSAASRRRPRTPRSSPTACSTSSSAAAARPASRWPAVCTSCTGWCWRGTSRSSRCATPASRSSRWATACWRRSRPPRRSRRGGRWPIAASTCASASASTGSSGSWSTCRTARSCAPARSCGPRGSRPRASPPPLGSPTTRGGRLVVEPDLSIPGHPEVFAIGDIAAAPGPDGAPLPQVAQPAIQGGKHVARQILRRLRGEADRAVPVPRQGPDGDDRSSRRGHRARQRVAVQRADRLAGVARAAPRLPDGVPQPRSRCSSTGRGTT